MSDENKTLDLDELFGQSQPMKVKWQDREYELHNFTALSVTEVLSFQKMRREAARLQIMDEAEKINSVEIERLFNGMLLLICPELPLEEMPYVTKPSILAFYFENIEQKKKMNKGKKMTGEKSSPS